MERRLGLWLAGSALVTATCLVMADDALQASRPQAAGKQAPQAGRPVLPLGSRPAASPSSGPGSADASSFLPPALAAGIHRKPLTSPWERMELWTVPLAKKAAEIWRGGQEGIREITEPRRHR
jgi:hypothetical protein